MISNRTVVTTSIGVLITLFVTIAGFGLAPAGAEPTVGPETAPIESRESVEPGVRDSITRLYLAALGRQPDSSGQDYWVDRYVNGTHLAVIAESFLASSEWQRQSGAVDDAEFVRLLYRHVLDRDPDDSGHHYWLGRAATGLSRTEMLLWFSESDEFVRRTGTATPVPPPFPSVPPDSGTGRRIVYSNSAQRVWIVEATGLVRDSYAVSGRRNVPNPGVYSIYSKSPVAWAGHDGITMNHMVRFAHGRRLAIGFHSIPRYANGAPMQTEAELGTYRSAGCVRQAEGKARALYHWAALGDMVVVLP